MRGRTNIPPRIGGIVNGAIKQCVVADGNDIEIGDYVQLNLKEGALPVMLKDTGATNTSNSMSDWLFYSFKTFALSDGNILNISPYSVASNTTTVASQVVLVNGNGLAEGIRVTKTGVTQGSWGGSTRGYGPFSACKLYEDCFLVIHSAYREEYHNFCRACLLKYSPSTKTVTATSLDTSGVTDIYFKGYGYYSGNTPYTHNALGVVNGRILRFTYYNPTSSYYAYEVFVDESAASLTCKQLTLDYGALGSNVLYNALQSLEDFSNGYFGLLYTTGVYCRLSGDIVTTAQSSNIALGTRIESGVYAGGAAHTAGIDTTELINRTMSDVTIAAGVNLSMLGSTYVGKIAYDVVVKADAIGKQLDLQDTWEEDCYSSWTDYDKYFTYFGIVFVKCNEGAVLGIMPVPQIAHLQDRQSGNSQQQIMVGCYCGIFSFDEVTQSFAQSTLTFDTFVAFEEPVTIDSASYSSYTDEGYSLCGIESAFAFNDVVRIGLWFYSRYAYSTSYTFDEKFMSFTIRFKDGKVVDFSDKNIVEKYTHHVFGIAKTGGASGATIEVYMPQ